MTLDLAFTLSGRITVHSLDGDQAGRDGEFRDRTSDGGVGSIVKAFESSTAEAA